MSEMLTPWCCPRKLDAVVFTPTIPADAVDLPRQPISASGTIPGARDDRAAAESQIGLAAIDAGHHRALPITDGAGHATDPAQQRPGQVQRAIGRWTPVLRVGAGSCGPANSGRQQAARSCW